MKTGYTDRLLDPNIYFYRPIVRGHGQIYVATNNRSVQGIIATDAPLEFYSDQLLVINILF
jgi:hypothetical protein